MDFIFMLTRQDVTVAGCRELMDAIAPLGLAHVGFKDLGVDAEVLRHLNRRIKTTGALSYMEIVSEDAEAQRRSARLAVEIGVDRLLGGSDVGSILAAIAGSAIEYYPYPGLPSGHPTRLGGTPAAIAADCRRIKAAGCHGVDLLAFRATEAEPLELIRAARSALGDARLIVAGSVNSRQRIRDIAEAGADAFTMGSALLDGSFAPRAADLPARLAAVMRACDG